MIIPPYLKPGDKIGFISTAGIVYQEEIKYALEVFKSNGFRVVVGKTIGKIYHNFAGNDDFRLNEIQQFINDPSIKAIIFTRGGYGTVRIIDSIDFSLLIKNPKWMVGFSDLTILHNHIQRNFDIVSIHGPMAKSLRDNRSKDILLEALTGKPISYKIKGNKYNLPGTTQGQLVGGNLSLLNNISGTNSDFIADDKILFLEETGEYHYHIDRMLWGLKRSKDFSKLKGVVIGQFSRMKKNRTPFGKNRYELILEHFEKYNIPVIFDFPAGHNQENFPLYIGRKVKIESSRNFSKLEFL